MKRKRTPKPARCPTMVAMLMAPEVELTERMALESFASGWADVPQFDVLANCRDLLMLAAGAKEDEGTLAVCRLVGIALNNIKDRYIEKKRLGATGEELHALRLLIDTSEGFWKLTSGDLFLQAHRALDKARGWTTNEAL